MLLDEMFERVLKIRNTGRNSQGNDSQDRILSQNGFDDQELGQSRVRESREIHKVHQRRQIDAGDG